MNEFQRRRARVDWLKARYNEWKSIRSKFENGTEAVELAKRMKKAGLYSAGTSAQDIGVFTLLEQVRQEMQVEESVKTGGNADRQRPRPPVQWE